MGVQQFNSSLGQPNVQKNNRDPVRGCLIFEEINAGKNNQNHTYETFICSKR